MTMPSDRVSTLVQPDRRAVPVPSVRTVALLTVVMTAIMATMVGCGSIGKQSTDSASSAPPDMAKSAGAERTSSAGATADVATADGSVAQATGSNARSASQQKIFTASLDVTAKSPTEVAERARVIVETAGGFISGQDSSGTGVESVSMVLKVPPEKIGPVLTDLAKLGKETDRTLKGEDVTGQVVDLDARIVTARASVERVREFLGATKNVGELAGIEAELTRRETDLEVLVGQQRTLAAQVDLATITLVVSERPIVVAAEPGDFLKSVPGFGDALAGGFNALVAALRVLAAGLGYVFPFVAVVGLGLALRRLVRTVRAGRNTQSLKVRSS